MRRISIISASVLVVGSSMMIRSGVRPLKTSMGSFLVKISTYSFSIIHEFACAVKANGIREVPSIVSRTAEKIPPRLSGRRDSSDAI
jgi:hypothetical protein